METLLEYITDYVMGHLEDVSPKEYDQTREEIAKDVLEILEAYGVDPNA